MTNLAEFLGPDKNVEELVEDFMLKGHVNLIAGPSGSSKSWIIEQLCICVATGSLFLGKKVEKGRVLLLDHDSAPEILKLRLRRLAKGLKIDLNEIAIQVHCKEQGSFNLDDKKQVTAIKNGVIKNDISLIVVDSLSSILGSLSENNMQEARIAWNELRGNSTLVLVHHFGKEAERTAGYIKPMDESTFRKYLRGSSKLYESVDLAYAVMGREFPFIVNKQKERSPVKTLEFAVDIQEDEKQREWANLIRVPIPPAPLSEDEKQILEAFLTGACKGEGDDGSWISVKSMKNNVIQEAMSVPDIRQAMYSLKDRKILQKGAKDHNLFLFRFNARSPEKIDELRKLLSKK